MRRVLVIDDHEPSRKILGNTLLQDGYQIPAKQASETMKKGPEVFYQKADEY